jgi:uncharacterized damage-inducible protein DinB
MTAGSDASSQERADLIEALAAHRDLFLRTVQGVDDEQAKRRTTVSELTLGGLVKHVTKVERQWAEFIERGPDAIGGMSPEAFAAHAASFRMEDGETLAGLVDAYLAVGRETEELVRTLPSLDVSHPLPEAPWFEPGARRTARRAFVHIVAETAQHAGHADIIREALDGAKTMG